MILFLLIVVVNCQTIIVQPPIIYQEANYTFNYESSTDIYNIIKITFPFSYSFNNLNYNCIYNNQICQATGNSNILTITNINPNNKIFSLILENIINDQEIGNHVCLLEIYQNEILQESASSYFSLKKVDQFVAFFNFDDYSTFTKTNLTITLETQYLVKQNTILEIIFPNINDILQGQQQFSMLSDQSFPLINGKTIIFENNSQNGQLRIINIFDEAVGANINISLTICNIYTPNLERAKLLFTFNSINQVDGVIKSEITYAGYFFANLPEYLDIQSVNQEAGAQTNLNFLVKPRFGYPKNSILTIEILNQQNLITQASFNPLINLNTELIFEKFQNCLIIYNFNKNTDSSIYQFEIQNFINPTIDQNLNLQLSISTYNRILIEKVQYSLKVTPIRVPKFDIYVSNQTVFALTNIKIKIYLTNIQTKFSTVHFKIPKQIIFQEISNFNILPQEIYQIIFQDNLFLITNFFLQDQFQNFIEFNFYGVLVGQVGITDNFEFYIVDDSGVILTQLFDAINFEILPSEFTITSFKPEVQTADIKTNYKIVLQIPEINPGSLLKLLIPDQLYTDEQFCSSQANNKQKYCKIITREIQILLDQGGEITIILHKVQTERYLDSFEYTFNGQIQYLSKINSLLTTQKVSYQITKPQTFYQYSIQATNLYFGFISQITIMFYLKSNIILTDIMEIEIPECFTNIQSCGNRVIEITKNKIYINNLNSGMNKILCEIQNPNFQQNLYPFYYKINTLQGQLVAEFADFTGIQNNLKYQLLVFSVIQSSFYFQEKTSLNFSIQLQQPIKVYDQLIITLNGSPLKPQAQLISQELMSQLFYSSDIYTTYFFEGDNLVITLNFQREFDFLNTTINIDGFLLNSEVGVYATKITIQHMNRFYEIVEDNQVLQNFIVMCHESCETCSTTYNKCVTCRQGFQLFQNNCIKDCPQNTVEINKQCSFCQTSKSCEICDHNNTRLCLKCQNGYNLIENQCLNNNILKNSSSEANLQMSNNLNNSQKDNNINQTQKKVIFDTIPILLIIMFVQFVFSIYKKWRNKQDSFTRQFYNQIMLLEFPVAVTRFIRFVLIAEPSYLFMSMISLILTLSIQILGNQQLTFLKNNKIKYQLFFKTITLKEQLILLLQWRFILHLVNKQKNQKDLSQDLQKILKGQILPQLFSISFLIAFMADKKQFYYFAFDDVTYNILAIIFMFINKYWKNDGNQIYPEQIENNQLVQIPQHQNIEYV